VPQVLVNSVAVAKALGAAAAAQRKPAKPVLACLMGQASLEEAFKAAHAAQIPAYTFPEDTVAACGVLWQRSRWQIADSRLQIADCRLQGVQAVERAKARREVQNAILLAKSAGRYTLDAVEARSLLDAYGIATPAEALATSPHDAARFGREIGFPVVLKVISADILHKTDVGGVILNVQDEQAASAGFETLVARASTAHPGAVIRGVQVQKMVAGGQEVIIGAKRDPTFGPLVMFGLGGIYVEVLRDVSFRLAPLTPEDAAEMIDEMRSAKLLGGVRGAPPADRDALINAIVCVGQLAADHPEIAELDINPLLVLPQGQGAVAVDARIILG
jgi:acetyltransferase